MKIHDFFTGEQGLAKFVHDYSPRTAQIEMAEAIEKSIHAATHVIVEAGTGTGKTFAYLVPALLSGKKVIVSTGTKNLQDQLYNKDVPLIRTALANIRHCDVALLKGRANYLCTYRLEIAMQTNYGFSKAAAADLMRINQWAQQTVYGDITELDTVMENSPAWIQATSTRENCLGGECPDYDGCFLTKARLQAQEADLVVVNHHLLCADWAIKDEGGELLPDAEVVIIDEAHQLSETASNFLGITLGSKQLSDLAQDSLNEYFSGAKDQPDLRAACDDLTHELRNMRLDFGEELRRGEWVDLEANTKVMLGLKKLHESLERLTDQLDIASVRTKGLESCFKRAEVTEKNFIHILADNSGKWIRWYEVHSKSFSLNLTPLDIASEFSAFIQLQTASWVFTSATLSVDHKFEHFTRNLGLKNIASYSWDSPFDFNSQSLFYHPKGLPMPNEADFIDAIVKVALPVINASKGRTFFLFTSHKALRRAAELLADDLDYPLLIQGDKSKAVLLEDFKKMGNAVLLGTASFWEGIDVRGETLSTVIIDKLPFASPGDPILKARLAEMNKQGLNAFMHYQLPAAVIALRQGVGRLIRDEEDRGVLLLCDARLLKKQYGHTFLNSLPAMRRTRDIKDVEDFFATHE